MRLYKSSMRPAGSAENYVRAPLGTYCAGRTILHFTYDETLCGAMVWGRPNEADAELFVRLSRAPAPGRAPVSFFDLHRLEAADPRAFAVVASADIPSQVVREAVVRPPGLLGAVVAGFYELVPRGYPVHVFADRVEAMRWIGHADGPAILAELDALQAATSGTPPTVRALRDFLAANLGSNSIADAARALAMSERALQHHLRESKTTFRDERQGSRIRAAQALLADTDTKLTVVALEVGCSSLQHFSAMFRKATGESPSEWRDRQKRAKPG